MKKVLYIVSALALLSFFAFDLRTQAQQHEPSVRDELALAVAKVGVNEAGWRSPGDIGLIWQITEGRARTDEARLAWLRQHSSCVLTDRPLEPYEQRHGNCSWSRHLADDDLEPEGWPAGVIWQNYVRRWKQVRNLARRLVDGRSSLRPCDETPITWGGAMDHARAIAHGLRPVRCERTLNTGYIAVARDPS